MNAVTLNSTPIGFRSVPARVAYWANIRPDATAILDGDQCWSYAALQRRAEGIARILIEEGVRPEQFVALAVERSGEFIAALLGVWSAGAVAIPLDLTLPRSRLDRMISTGTVAVGLTSGRPPQLAGITRWIQTGAKPTSTIALPELQSHSGAYVVFTSGSTGAPKAIVGLHGGLANYFDDLDDRGWLTHSDTVLQISGIGYDAFFRDACYPLSIGATTVIARSGGRDLATMIEMVTQYEVTALLTLVPTLLREVNRLASRRGIEMPLVRTILLSGERLMSLDVVGMHAAFPAALAVNMYGPSETTLTTTSYVVPPGAQLPKDVPLGQPIRGTSVYILDGSMRAVPPGIAGDVFVAGSGVSRGYWNAPGLTASAFLPDLYQPSARMYRTGDRARWRSDGSLEYLGRSDGQLKIRGQRVELGEIESVLREFEGVHDAACAAGLDETGQLIVSAFIVPSAEAQPKGAQELTRALSSILPAASVPSRFAVVDALPRTSTGKLDRRALLSAVPQARPGPPAAVSPRTPSETALAGIWNELLGNVGPGIDESFFELGGHSLLAMRLATRVGEVFNLHFPLRAIFDSPTLALQAAIIDKMSNEGFRSDVPPDTESPTILRLSPAQRRVWEISRAVPHSGAFNVSAVFRIVGALDYKVLSRALTEVLRRHEALRMRFPMDGDNPQPLVGKPHSLQPDIVIVPLGEEDVENWATQDIRTHAALSFDLARGPLLRVRLLRVKPGHHLLQIVVHHIIFDGWSMSVMYKEVVALFSEYSGDGPSLLSVPMQFPAFAEQQASDTDRGRWDREATMLRSRIDPDSSLVELSDGYPFLDHRDRMRRYRRAGIDGALITGLNKLARKHRSTPATTLLTAFAAALSTVFGKKTFQVSVPVANRHSEEDEGMIGYLSNSVLVPIKVTDAGLIELLLSVRASLLGAHEHGDVPTEVVVLPLAPISLTPELRAAQVLFNMQLDVKPILRLRNLEISVVEKVEPWSRFPVALYVDQTGVEFSLTFVCDAAKFDDTWIDGLRTTFFANLERLVEDDSPPAHHQGGPE